MGVIGLRRRIAAALFVAVFGLTALPAEAAPATWVPTLSVGVQGTDTITAFPDGTVYEFHTAGGIGGFYRSRDHGLSWTPLAEPPSNGFATQAFTSPTVGYAADINGIVHRTMDGATTWPKTSPLPGTTGHAIDLTAIGAAKGKSTVMVAASQYRPFHAGCNWPVATPIWTSHDGGRRWIRVDLGLRKSVFSLDVFDQDVAVARVYDVTAQAGCRGVGDRNAIYVTRNGGRSWQRALSCPVEHICTAAAFVSRTKLWVGRNDGSTAVSTDVGRTFRAGTNFVNALGKPTNTAQYYWVQGIAFATPLRGWLSVKGVGTYRTDDGGTQWTLEHSQDEVFGLGVGDADAASYEHAVIAGPTLVSTRVGDGTQRPQAQPLHDGVAAASARMSVNASGVLRMNPAV